MTREVFDTDSPPTIGIEEEVLLLDPETFEPAPVATALLSRLADQRFRLELPASQLEIASDPCATVAEALAQLREGRARLASSAEGLAAPAVAGVHPFATESALNSGCRYDQIAERFGAVARRQLVCGLHVHVAIRPAERALRAYNALRSHLPLIAALGANAPFYEGRDSGFASVRPRISQLLPRQGVPPPIESFDELEAALAWGERSGLLPDRRQWWWELRLHPRFGTVEVRVPDAQTNLEETAGLAALVQCLVVRLADHGEVAAVPTWRIEESSWQASRQGLDAVIADPLTGESIPARARLESLLAELRAVAERLGCQPELQAAAELSRHTGADRQREVSRGEGAVGLARWLAHRFLGTVGG